MTTECVALVGCWLLGMLVLTSVAGKLLVTGGEAMPSVPSAELAQQIQEAFRQLDERYQALVANEAVRKIDAELVSARKIALQEAEERLTVSAAEVARDRQAVEQLRRALHDAIEAMFGGTAVGGVSLADALAAPGATRLEPARSELGQILEALNQTGAAMSAISDAVDALAVKVEANSTIIGSGITLIEGLAVQLKEIAATSNDPATVAKVNELGARLEADKVKLAEKIAANTPTGPPAPEPLPPEPGPVGKPKK